MPGFYIDHTKDRSIEDCEKIEAEVRRATTQWLPYINIISVQTLTDEKDQNKIFVSVEFSTSLNPSDVGSLTVTPNTTSTNY